MSHPLTPASIKELRMHLGLTQVELADRLGCSAQTISFWERGTRSPTGLYARAIRDLLAETDAFTAPPPDRPATAS